MSTAIPVTAGGFPLVVGAYRRPTRLLNRPHRPGSATGRVTRSLPNSAVDLSRFMRVGADGLKMHHVISLSLPVLGSSRSTSGASVAGHTRTSLLRTLNSSGHFEKEWLLPETKDMFDKQWSRQQRFIEEDDRKLQKRARRKKKLLDPMNMSSKKWLSRNGLNALKLTILDALAPTLIPHEPTYVPILNKHVLSKVFDDVLPIAHASGNRKKIRIVNPQGVDLKGYITKVEKAEARYHKRLNAIVWNALPQSAQEEFGDGPVSYIENRVKLDAALDTAGCPIPERDLVLLESEIKQARVYIKQARDLLDATATSRKDDDARSVSSAGSRSEKKKKGTNRLHRVYDMMKGQRIIGRNDADGFYYPGSVIRCTDMRHCVVEYDELGNQRVPTRFVIPMSGAISVPHLMAGDYVLSRVVNQETNTECYVPGIVQMTPRTVPARSKYFTVVLYTGQKDHFLRSYLVKISKLRYLFLVRYIQELSPLEPETDRSPSRSRSPSPAPIEPPVEDETDAMKQERIRLERWQRHLEEMQKEQKHTQKKLKKQAYKLEALRRRLKDGKGARDEEQRRLLELILNETKKPMDRTQEWVEDQSVEIALDKEKGDILVSSGDKGILISQKENNNKIIMEMRRTRSRLKQGEEVLARWVDDGWYYRGTVRQQVDDYCYYIEDSVGNLETIYREDILADSDDTNIHIQPKDTVVALHPNYTFSYAPGVVLETERALFMQVRFYDGHEARVARDEVYLLPHAKFELDVAFIVKAEDQLVGQAVVARNDETGVFQLGAVRERIGDGRQYVVERSDGELAIQRATCIFGAFTKRHPLSVGDHVLGIVQPRTLIYLPGTITDSNDDKLVVEFCDGQVSHHVEAKQCFWLSRDYFLSAVEFYNQRQAALSGGQTKGAVWTNNKERVSTKTTYELIEEKVDKVEITSDNESEFTKKEKEEDKKDGYSDYTDED